mmetsp:Transcript_5488/g.8527  ORF Transcript_5488/g.8527 Transcript_5488/m.8527 type:complete len:204 (+) Transcript_5488:74-685(+)
MLSNALRRLTISFCEVSTGSFHASASASSSIGPSSSSTSPSSASSFSRPGAGPSTAAGVSTALRGGLACDTPAFGPPGFPPQFGILAAAAMFNPGGCAPGIGGIPIGGMPPIGPICPIIPIGHRHAMSLLSKVVSLRKRGSSFRCFCWFLSIASAFANLSFAIFIRSFPGEAFCESISWRIWSSASFWCFMRSALWLCAKIVW